MFLTPETQKKQALALGLLAVLNSILSISTLMSKIHLEINDYLNIKVGLD